MQHHRAELQRPRSREVLYKSECDFGSDEEMLAATCHHASVPLGKRPPGRRGRALGQMPEASETPARSGATVPDNLEMRHAESSIWGRESNSGLTNG